MPNGVRAVNKDMQVHEKKRKTPSPVPKSQSPISGDDDNRSKTSSPVSLPSNVHAVHVCTLLCVYAPPSSVAVLINYAFVSDFLALLWMWLVFGEGSSDHFRAVLGTVL